MVDKSSYVDVNIFVYWLGKHPVFGEIAYEWIKKIERSPRGRYVTSSLTLYEVLVIIAGLTDKSLRDKVFVEEVINSITNLKGLVIEPLKPEDFIRALDLMEEYSLDYEDSLHLSVAVRTEAKEIISNDRDFDKTPLKRTG
ncbi:MAG: type II toxin-antitoxin system VapC family toxin [archaeon GB-1845-036]|nr:type II toxin-antitoxin system VapC family toxin [Candidatus Culexmicrobium thermophilum]